MSNGVILTMLHVVNGSIVAQGDGIQVLLGQGSDGKGVPVGGKKGQILSKASDTAYDTAWVDAPQGTGTGGTGVDGKSAYEVAVDNGYTGTEVQWLASLKGADGKDGVNGTDGKDGVNGADGKDGINGADGKDGVNGTDGKSAYEVAVDNGYTGTEADFATAIGSIGNVNEALDVLINTLTEL